MKKIIDAITEVGLTKLFWLAIAIVCFVFGATVDGFVPGLAARLGWAALGIFIYINFNVVIKYWTKFRGVIGWPPDISKEENEAFSRSTKY